MTELVTGIDLVRGSFASPPASRSATRSPTSVARRAIECRINAEDPFPGWFRRRAPSPGLGRPTRPWVRDDSGAYEGYTVPR